MSDYLKDNWDVVAADPLTFVLFALVLISASVAVTRTLLGHALEASRERVAAAHDEVARLRGEKSELLKRLEDHGDSITSIRAELAALPRHHVSEGPPPPDGEFRDGDLWLQVEPKTEARVWLDESEERMLRLMAGQPRHEFSPGELGLELGIPETTAAYNLERLEEAGLVVCREVIDQLLRYRLDKPGREYVVRHRL